MVNALIDIGANLTHDAFDDDFDEVLERAREQHIEQMIVTGATVQGSRDAFDLARRYPGFLHATAGIHPHHAEQATSDAMVELRSLAQHREVKAIGETGLDFFRNFSPRDAQIASFERHLGIAAELDMPLFLHERDAYPTFAEILTPWRDELGDIVVHCFTGEAEALHAYVDLDCYIGITGWICDERRGQHLLSLIKDIPPDRLMIETDAPYLLPRNIKPRPKSRRNEPAYLPRVCEAVAAATGESFEGIAARTTANAKRFFNL
ncbi:MAG: TatD family hydrolase [Pseudomonadales bacterium]